MSPPRGAGLRTSTDAADFIAKTMEDGVEIFAVCEVNADAVAAIADRLSPDGIDAVSLTARSGPRSRWDLAVFHRSPRLTCAIGSPITAEHGGTIRAAYGVNVTMRDPEFPNFVLYVLHWRSRLRGDGGKERSEASDALWRRVREDIRLATPVVVLGDFNDEPFDRPLSSQLRASRDPRHVVRSPTSRLYNPTWWLASPRSDDPWAAFGTAEHDEGWTSTRYLFDQALTSADFLDEQTRTAPSARVLAPPAPTTSRTMDHVPLELVLP